MSSLTAGIVVLGGFTVDKKVADNFKPEIKKLELPAKDKTPKPLVKAQQRSRGVFEGRGLATAEKMGVKSIHHFIPALSKAVDCLAFPYNAMGETAWKVRIRG